MNKRDDFARWDFKVTTKDLKRCDLTYDFESLVIYYLVLRLSPTSQLNKYFTNGYNALAKFYGFNIDDPIIQYLTKPDMQIIDFELKEEVYGKLLIDFKNCFFRTVLPAQPRVLTLRALFELGIMINEAHLNNSYTLVHQTFMMIYKPEKKTTTSWQLRLNYGFDDELLIQDEDRPYRGSKQKLRPNIELVKRVKR